MRRGDGERIQATFPEPRLLVIGKYLMGFELAPKAGKTLARVWIDYNLPSGIPGRWPGRLLGKVYADWCVTRMASDPARAFDGE
jgi:hypothetical protein